MSDKVFFISARIISTQPCNSLDVSTCFSWKMTNYLGTLAASIGSGREGGGLLDHGVGVVLVDLEEISGSSSSTSGSDTSSGAGGCHRCNSCCCLLDQLGLEVTCHPSLDSDDVLQHKVKAVENPLVQLSIVSYPVTRWSLHRFTKSCLHTIESSLQHCNLYM